MGGLVLAIWGADVHASSSCLSELGSALNRFRGLGYTDIQTYVVDVTLPEDGEEEAVTLEEVWRAPNEVLLRSGGEQSPAIVRSLALYLEPVYVARSSLLDVEWEAVGADLEKHATVKCSARGDEREIVATIEESAMTASDLPEVFHELESFRAELDSWGRLTMLEARFRQGGETLALTCTYRTDEVRQPHHVHWALPNDNAVTVVTEFAKVDGRTLPTRRVVTLPNRFDPKETEEIEVRYENYRLGAPVSDADFASARAFRFDENGLVAN